MEKLKTKGVTKGKYRTALVKRNWENLFFLMPVIGKIKLWCCGFTEKIELCQNGNIIS